MEYKEFELLSEVNDYIKNKIFIDFFPLASMSRTTSESKKKMQYCVLAIPKPESLTDRVENSAVEFKKLKDVNDAIKNSKWHMVLPKGSGNYICLWGTHSQPMGDYYMRRW